MVGTKRRRYAAQLIHYGLPVTKDKNGAKVRLLNALNASKLEIPASVLKLEGELKKEWEGENRKMKGGGAAKKGKGAGAAKAQPANAGISVNGKWERRASALGPY